MENEQLKLGDVLYSWSAVDTLETCVIGKIVTEKDRPTLYFAEGDRYPLDERFWFKTKEEVLDDMEQKVEREYKYKKELIQGLRTTE